MSNGAFLTFPVGSKATKIFQPVKRQRLSTEENEKNGILSLIYFIYEQHFCINHISIRLLLKQESIVFM